MTDLATHLEANIKALDVWRTRSSASPPEFLRQRQFDIVRLHIEGKTDIEVAAAVGCTTATVRNCLEAQTVKEFLGQVNALLIADAVDMKVELERSVPAAVYVAQKIMLDNGEKAKDRLSAVRTILEATGHVGQRRGGAAVAIVQNFGALRERMSKFQDVEVEAVDD